MKIITKVFGIIAVGAIIAAGLSACTTAAPVELDAETLAAMESASWEAKALANYPMLLYRNQFEECDKNEIAYFRNIPKITELEDWTYYALTAPEFPGTYYYLRKKQESGLISGLISGGAAPWDMWKSSTIDDETFDRNNTLLGASWVAKVLEGQPSLEGFEELTIANDVEYMFVKELAQKAENMTAGAWCEITAPDLPGITYYYTGAPGASISTINAVYKSDMR